MAARAVASPMISFGLISLPTKAYLAASAQAVSFNQITPDNNRTKQKVFDSVTDKEVDKTTLRKGYEYAKDQYVIFTDEEIDSLAGEKTNGIELTEFISDTYFNPIQVEKCYYLAPETGAERTYKLLARAMEKLGKVAIGKWCTRGKDHLVMLRPVNGRLVMFQMYYNDELRGFEYVFSAAEPSERELDLASKLIGQLSSKDFDPTKYADEFTGRVKKAIETKLSGGTLKLLEAPKQMDKVMDLAALLEASLEPVLVKTG